MNAELWFDDAVGFWTVTWTRPTGSEFDSHEIVFQGCSPDALDKANAYDCEATRQGPGFYVTKIGEVIGTFE